MNNKLKKDKSEGSEVSAIPDQTLNKQLINQVQ